MSLTDQQLALRRTGITATDVAAIVHQHPYRSIADVWVDKLGDGPPFDGNQRTKWGELLEPVVRSDFAARRSCRVEVPGTLVHPSIDWAMATPDGLFYYDDRPDPEEGVEIKCHTWHLIHQYGDALTDEVPIHELIQCTWNMHVTGLRRWFLVAFIDGQPLDYVIERDDELVAMLAEAAERFLVDNVRGGAPPAPDGTAAYADFLVRRFPKHMGDDLIKVAADDPDVLALRIAEGMLADATAERDRVQQLLKARIGDKSGLVWRDPDGKERKVTWRKAKDSHPVDHEGALGDVLALVAPAAMALEGILTKLELQRLDGDELAAALAPIAQNLTRAADRRAILAARTTTKPGSRRFNKPRSWKAARATNEEE